MIALIVLIAVLLFAVWFMIFLCCAGELGKRCDDAMEGWMEDVKRNMRDEP